VITEPTDGAIVPPVHTIRGTGVADAEVALWYVENDQQVATTTADAAGAWAFDGDTPSALGPVTWEVRQGDATARVAVTVEGAAADTSRKKDKK
jgi:hypothetical protein